jgi:hypothetical protein
MFDLCSRFMSRKRAVLLGLAALQEAMKTARQRPLQPTLQLRSVLAFLHAASGGGDEAAYRAFWTACGQGQGRDQALHAAWLRIAIGCGFNPDAVGFNETVERLLAQTRQAEVAWAMRAGAHRPPKPNHDCGWL